MDSVRACNHWEKDCMQSCGRIAPGIRAGPDRGRRTHIPDRRGWLSDSHLAAHPLQGSHHVFAAIAEAGIDHRHVAREGVDHGQHPDLAAGRKLVMDKVHGPGLVRPGGITAVVAQLRLDPTLRRLVAQLQAHFTVKPMRALVIDLPSFSPQQDVDPPVSVANTGRGKFLDLHFEAGLIEAARLVALGRSIDRKGATDPPFAHLVARLQIADDLPSSIRPYIFRRMTS